MNTSLLSHILLFIAGFLLFFFGLNLFRKYLKLISNERLSGILAKMTTTPLRGAVFGALVTAAVQSSSAVMVVTIGLIDAGLLRFPQAVGIILGTNVGTCVTVQLLGLDFSRFSIPCILWGLFLLFLGKRNAGAALSGFGCIFLGITLITYTSSPLIYSTYFQAIISTATERPLGGILIGAVSTAIIQYSSVVIGVIIALSQHNSIPLSAAVPLVLGSNLGTCFTGVLASIGGSRGAQQAAAAHILLNVLGIAACIPILDGFVEFVSLTTQDSALQIANSHTLFNLLSSLLILPFAKPFAGLVTAIIPDKR